MKIIKTAIRYEDRPVYELDHLVAASEVRIVTRTLREAVRKHSHIIKIEVRIYDADNIDAGPEETYALVSKRRSSRHSKQPRQTPSPGAT